MTEEPEEDAEGECRSTPELTKINALLCVLRGGFLQYLKLLEEVRFSCA
jgi:hypothetical protein